MKQWQRSLIADALRIMLMTLAFVVMSAAFVRCSVTESAEKAAQLGCPGKLYLLQQEGGWWPRPRVYTCIPACEAKP